MLAVCVLLLAGSAGCGTSSAHGGRNGRSASPVGKVLEGTDKEGSHLRQVDKKHAPEVGIEVQPDTGDSWDVRLTLHHFRFSAAGSRARPVAGHGYARLYVDGRLVSPLRTTGYRLPARLVPRGTHHVTARLYADDGTVWAVKGEPVESTADITSSDPQPSGTPSGTPGGTPGAADPTGTARPSGTRGGTSDGASTESASMSASGIGLRTERRGSPDHVEEAS